MVLRSRVEARLADDELSLSAGLVSASSDCWGGGPATSDDSIGSRCISPLYRIKTTPMISHCTSVFRSTATYFSINASNERRLIHRSKNNELTISARAGFMQMPRAYDVKGTTKDGFKIF